MDLIDLSQLANHDFDLRVRDEPGVDANVLMSRYHEILVGVPLTDEYISRFEKALACIITSNAMHIGLLEEMNFAGVEPGDAQNILRDGPVPSDEVQDLIAGIRAAFDEAAEKYAEELADLTLIAPVDPMPSEEQARAAKLQLARYICAAILTDDREENQL